MPESHLDIRYFPWGIESGCRGVAYAEYVQQFLLEFFRRDTIWIVRRRSEGYWEITKGNFEEGLCHRVKFHFKRGQYWN